MSKWRFYIGNQRRESRIMSDQDPQNFSLLRVEGINTEVLASLMAAFDSTNEEVKAALDQIVVLMRMTDPAACHVKRALLEAGRETFAEQARALQELYRYARHRIAEDGGDLRGITEHMTMQDLRNLLDLIRQPQQAG